MTSLLKYLKQHRARFGLACGASIANKILDLMTPLLVGWVIDSVRGDAPKWIRFVMGTAEPWPLAIFLACLGVGIFVFESTFQWGFQYGFMTLAQQVQHQLRTDAYDQIQRREIAFFEEHRLGDTMAILNDDVNQLERFLNTGFNSLLQLAVLLLFSSTVMLSTCWELALIGIIPIPIIVFGSFYYQRLIAPRYAALRSAVGSLVSRLENNLSGMAVIRSFTAETFESARVEEASRSYMAANTHAIRLSVLYVPLIRGAVAVGFGGVLLLGSYWVLAGTGRLTVGELVLFGMMIQLLLWPLTGLASTFDDFERARASARRVFGLLETPSAIQSPESPKPMSKTASRIEFRDVYFHYTEDVPVLEGLSFTVEPGETIGIAGTTGCGKSTLIKLLLRYYDTVRGSVTIGPHDVRELSLHDLRRHVGLVSQDVYLFHGSIGENIAYGVPETASDAIERAARLAEMDTFIESLPEGYETGVGEKGIKLSGGQRQRLSIARAILKDAPIMVFDEATSSVDTETERAIQTNLLSLTKGKTALIIAHRLSTIRHVDRILVLSGGRVSEQGTHDELLAQNGTYADLWRLQVGAGER